MDKTGRFSSDPRTEALKPALVSIPEACRYLGGVSRAKLYEDLLSHLDTVHIGSRHFVVVSSMDQLIAKLKDGTADKPPSRRSEHLSQLHRHLDELTGKSSARLPAEHT